MSSVPRDWSCSRLKRSSIWPNSFYTRRSGSGTLHASVVLSLPIIGGGYAPYHNCLIGRCHRRAHLHAARVAEAFTVRRGRESELDGGSRQSSRPRPKGMDTNTVMAGDQITVE